MCSLFGNLCQALGAGAVVGGPTIHIRAHRRRIGFSPPSKGTPEQKSEAGSAVMTTIHGLSQREWEPRLRIFTDDFPREMMRMLTGKLGCRGSVVEDPVSGPVVYLEGDRRSIIGTWMGPG
ncbi:hypothetical protein PG993_005255 [Apiospora rasikravindrae]|uniref:SUI1 domain-containing protein n=1 Tax=Apiospora rasikravindrae TaxID=990691 RepID=A0ABR1TGZ3_9PEZI